MRINLRRAAAGRRGVTAFAVGVVATMTLAGGGVALGAIPSSSSAKFTGCVAKSGGALRVIDAQAGKKCKSTEKTISWSKGWTHRGAWAAGDAYKPGDVVTASGSSYVAKVKSTGSAPATTPTAWGLLAAAGAAGAQGAQGPPGVAGTNGAPGTNGLQGPPGPVDVVYVSDTGDLSTGAFSTRNATCPFDLSLVGGGVTTTAGGTVDSSGPVDFGPDVDILPDDRWTARISNPSPNTIQVSVVAICVEPTSIIDASN